jgi:Putative adhesin
MKHTSPMNQKFKIFASTLGVTLAAGLGMAATLRAEEQVRTFQQPFPAGGEVRLANLAGRVEIQRGTGRDVVVDATVHADFGGGETQRQLRSLKWVRGLDKKGREEWVLSYPVEKYRSYSYPAARDGKEEKESGVPELLSFLSFAIGNSTTTTYRGERVKVLSGRHSSAPVLYADLRITLPANSRFAFRNAIGAVRGGDLEGTLAIDTGSGDVQIGSSSGQLTIDTGSGNVVVGSTRGETSISTGSGDVVVRRLVGNGAVDTGSGNVTVQKVSAGKLTLDTGSGDVTLQDGEAGRVIAKTGSGGVKVLAVELEDLTAETGSGDVTVQSSLARTKRLSAGTGSGDIDIKAGPGASFTVASDQGSGELTVGYADAVLRKSGHKVVGAKRGDGRTAIKIETGSGDCMIRPRG